MTTLPALVLRKPQMYFWHKLSEVQRNHWLDIALKYRHKIISKTPKAIIGVPHFVVLPEILAPPVQEIGRILRFDEFNLKKLLTTTVTTKYELGTISLFLRSIPYIPQNLFPLFAGDQQHTQGKMIMAAMRIGDLFFISVDLMNQFREFSSWDNRQGKVLQLFSYLDILEKSWEHARKISNSSANTSFELYREIIQHGMDIDTAVLETSAGYIKRIETHIEWIQRYFNWGHDPKIRKLRRYYYRLKSATQSENGLQRAFLEEYEEIIEMPHALYAVTKPIKIGYALMDRGYHESVAERLWRPRMPPTRYLLIIPKVGFLPDIATGNVTVISGNNIGHPHLYSSGRVCYGNVGTIFGDAYTQGNYTTMLIRAAALLRNWNPQSLADHNWGKRKNLISCQEDCCSCSHHCPDRCTKCIIEEPEKFVTCEKISGLREPHSYPDDSYLMLLHPLTFSCGGWQTATLSLCCADNQCPFYTDTWTEQDLSMKSPPSAIVEQAEELGISLADRPIPCRKGSPCAHCPAENCQLRKNDFIKTKGARASFTKALRGIRNRTAKRLRELDASEERLPDDD